MIAGTIIRILTQKDNDWGRYEIDSLGQKVIAVGIIPKPTIGMSVTLEGAIENNQYGEQFKIKSVLRAESDQLAGVRRFFTDGYVKYIGAGKANAIIQVYGKESLNLFETEEGLEKLALVKGITRKTLDKALPSYNENKKYKDIVLFLDGSGSRGQVEKIYQKYGDGAIQVLTKNPYRLQLDLDGFGFLKADAIARAAGVKPDSIYRIQAAIKYLIEQAERTGNCYLSLDQINEQIEDLLVPLPHFDDISEIVAGNAIKEWPASKEKLIKAHNPCYETLEKLSQTKETRNEILASVLNAIEIAISEDILIYDGNNIYTKKMYETEQNCAKNIVKMLRAKPTRYISPELVEAAIKRVELRKTEALHANGVEGAFITTDEQRESVYLGTSHRLCVISGGPGRGKTAIIEIIAEAYMAADLNGSIEDVFMLAPTGAAAQRITESTGYPSMTAQRAIVEAECKKIDLKGKLIVMDESSMADIYLINSLMNLCVENDASLIMVGDVDQIASVGPGKVLRDMIESEVIPYMLLKQGHRNTGSIASNSQLINAGAPLNKYTYDQHFVYSACDKDNIADKIIADYCKKVNEYGIKNVMLAVAMVSRGNASVKRLNSILQEQFTKGNPEAKYGEKVFRLGDRVMQTRNNYNFVRLSKDKQQFIGIFNGEKGTVVSIINDETDPNPRMVVLFDDGSLGGYTSQTADDLALCYAITLHKCQGSEAKCVLIAYTFADYLLLNRSLFYTGATRAKKELRLYGEEAYKYGKMLSAFDVAVSRLEDTKRNTGLKEGIKKEYCA